MKILITSLILSTLFLSNSMAQDSSRKRRGPPQEAIDACQSSSAGDSCSFSGRDGETLSGTCDQKEESSPLTCKPERR